MIVDNVKKHEICTGKLMKQVTGLTFCQNIKFPNASLHNEAPFFPFTGPVVYDLYMVNEDAPNGYQIEGFTKVRQNLLEINFSNAYFKNKIFCSFSAFSILAIRINRIMSFFSFSFKQSPYSFYMDTPNSKVSRRIAIDTVIKNKNEAHVTFVAPWKNIKIEG